jgi:hypothetical protein
VAAQAEGYARGFLWDRDVIHGTQFQLRAGNMGIAAV